MATAHSTTRPRASGGENKLTDTALKRLKLPESGKMMVSDGGELRADLLEAGGRRVARFSYRFQIDGKRAEMRLGTWPDVSLAELRAKRNQARDLVRQGKDPREAAKEEKAKIERIKAETAAKLTLKGAFEKWEILHLKRAYKDQGIETRRIFEKDVFPTLGNLALENLTRRHIAACVDTALERGAPRSAQMLLVYLRQLCRWSVTRGYLDSDPSAAFSKASIKVNPPRERVLTNGEVRALAKALPGAGLPPWALPALWLILATACRVGELLASRWDDFDLERREWLIPAEHTKNKRAHIVDLSDFALERLAALAKLRTGPWLVSGRRIAKTGDAPKPIDDKALTRLIKDRQRAEGEAPLQNRTTTHSQALILPGGNWTPHDLRRSSATFMQGLGVLPAVIEKCLNHTEANRMVQVYQRHDYRAERRDAFNRLGHHLEQLAGGEEGNVIALKRA
jgi:integrase